jgi:hypothetical protein
MKWEYMRRTFSINDNPEIFVNKLNELGDDFWELVSTFTIEEKGIGIFDSGAETSKIVTIFKRPKE